MDSDLIKLVNKLQDTFSNLGELVYFYTRTATFLTKVVVTKVGSWICPRLPL